MVKSKKKYDWKNDAILEDHSKQKLKILRKYFRKYLCVRCSNNPRQEQFRLAIVDGFSGGGLYKHNISGSPLIFVEELKSFIQEENIRRSSQNIKKIRIECLFIFNDFSEEAIDALKEYIAPHELQIREDYRDLDVTFLYMNQKFKKVYVEIKNLLAIRRFTNVLFNLDQCGQVDVNLLILRDIIETFNKPEIFLTFSIGSFLKYYTPKHLDPYKKNLELLGGSLKNIQQSDDFITKEEELGAAERIVYEVFKAIANYVSTFTIHNPRGWKYWLIHLSSAYRGREVYNDVLHQYASITQAHYGRPGINMLGFNSDHRDHLNLLYLFDKKAAEQSFEQLVNDVPRFLSESGDVTSVLNFYEDIYNQTPASSNTINQSLIENPDLEILTANGGKRRKANTIKTTDIIKLNPQKSFFFFPNEVNLLLPPPSPDQSGDSTEDEG